MTHMTHSLLTKSTDSPHAGVLGLLLFIPCFELGSGLYGDYPPMNEAGLQMLHDMYLDTGNTTGFWEALHAYQGSSSYRLVGGLLRKCLVCMWRCLFWYCMLHYVSAHMRCNRRTPTSAAAAAAHHSFISCAVCPQRHRVLHCGE